MARVQRSAPILTVSVAAELAGMHPQTVRQYDRLGLVVAHRTGGGGRRYSLADVDRLIEVQRLSQEDGINLAGIARILKLQDQLAAAIAKNARLEKQLARVHELGERMRSELERQAQRDNRVFAANSSGEVAMAEGLEWLRRAMDAVGDVSDSRDVVLWRPRSLARFGAVTQTRRA